MDSLDRIWVPVSDDRVFASAVVQSRAADGSATLKLEHPVGGQDSNVSPFLKMSFETCTQFLTKATLDGDRDDLTSPSSRLVLGKVVENGTGCFDVWAPLPRTIFSGGHS